MPTVNVRARVRTANTPHSIPSDNHSDLKRTSSIMISKSYRKFTTFPTGDYSVFFKEDYLSNKDLSDEIIGQSPFGEHCEFCNIKAAVIDFTQGAKVAGLSACPDFVTTANTLILRLRRMCPTGNIYSNGMYVVKNTNFINSVPFT